MKILTKEIKFGHPRIAHNTGSAPQKFLKHSGLVNHHQHQQVAQLLSRSGLRHKVDLITFNWE